MTGIPSSDVTEGSGTKLGARRFRQPAGQPFEAWLYTGQTRFEWPRWFRIFYSSNDPLPKQLGRYAAADCDGIFWRWFDVDIFFDSFEESPDGTPGDTPSADGTEALYAPSLNTSSLPQIPSIDARVKELTSALTLTLCELSACALQLSCLGRHVSPDGSVNRAINAARSALSQGSPGQ